MNEIDDDHTGLNRMMNLSSFGKVQLWK
jgi:hypothetical protein